MSGNVWQWVVSILLGIVITLGGQRVSSLEQRLDTANDKIVELQIDRAKWISHQEEVIRRLTDIEREVKNLHVSPSVKVGIKPTPGFGS